MYYAIKHKPTNTYLPMKNKTRGGRGFTFVNVGDKGIPRLFPSKRDARNALTWWLSGEVHTVHSSTADDDYFEDFKIDPRPDRKPEDMDVVPIDLVEMKGLKE